MRITLDTELCTGHGRCYTLAPGVFEPDDEGRGVLVVTGSVPAGDQDEARRAVLNCPENAIAVEE